MTDIKPFKSKRKDPTPVKKSRKFTSLIVIATIIGVLFTLTLAVLTVQAYSFRSPVIFQNPFVLRVNSPKPKISKPMPLKKAEVTPSPTPVAQVPAGKENIKKLICKYFGTDCEIATAVFRAESGLRAEAKGYNCYYTDSSGSRYAAACEVQDRAQAFSVDCGIAQINIAGQECPSELMNEEGNIKHAHGMYVRRGFQPWVAHSTGRYQAFLSL